MPPVPHCLMADVDAPFMEQVLDISERQRKPNVQHHRQADDLWARLEVAEGAAFRHVGTLSSALPWLKLSSSDSALLFVSGCTAAQPDGSLPQMPETQMRAAFENVMKALAAAGAGFHDVVEMTTYHVGLQAQAETFAKIKVEAIGGA